MNWIMIWLIVLVACAVIEIASVQLVAIWFCFGSLSAMIGAAFKLRIEWQFVLFFAVSLVLIFCTRPFVRKVLTPKMQRTNADRILDMDGIVTENINNLQSTGAVKVAGQIWTARTAEDDELITVGQRVKIKEIRGVKVIVEKVPPRILDPELTQNKEEVEDNKEQQQGQVE